MGRRIAADGAPNRLRPDHPRPGANADDGEAHAGPADGQAQPHANAESSAGVPPHSHGDQRSPVGGDHGFSGRRRSAPEWRDAVCGGGAGAGASDGRRRPNGRHGAATLELSEGSIIRVDRATSFELRDLSGDAGSPSTTLGLDLGRVLVFAAQVLGVTGFDVQTPAGVASVRGSYFSVAYDPATASIIVTCLESSDNCTFTAGPNTVTLHNGQSLIVDQQNFVLRVVDVSYEELQEFLALFPEAAEVLATAFPNGTPTPGASPTPTPLPTATDTNTPAAPALPVIILPTATFTPAPTQTPTPLPTNTERPERPAAPTATCVPSGTVPCPTP